MTPPEQIQCPPKGVVRMPCMQKKFTLYLVCRVTFAGVLIAFYIVTAIYEAKYLIPQTRVLSICHPDWGWCLAMGAAICWWLTSLLAIGEPSSDLQGVHCQFFKRTANNSDLLRLLAHFCKSCCWKYMQMAFALPIQHERAHSNPRWSSDRQQYNNSALSAWCAWVVGSVGAVHEYVMCTQHVFQSMQITQQDTCFQPVEHRWEAALDFDRC